MSGYRQGWDFPFKAGENFSTCGQYRWVTAGSVEDEVKLSTTAAGSVIGILQNNPQTGEEATVRMLGFSRAYANAEDGGSPLTAGGHIKSGSDGMILGSIDFAASGYNSAGIALDAVSTGSAILVEVFVYPAARLAG